MNTPLNSDSSGPERAEAQGGALSPRGRKRIWVQHVAVETDKLQVRVDAARARGNLTEPQSKVAEGVCGFISKARAAALGDDPPPRKWSSWWRGTLVEAAYRNMHAARAQVIELYTPEELRAEIPTVVARANATLHRDDPRRLTIGDLETETPETLRPLMRRLVADSYEKLDLEHAQLRSFRNIILLAAVLLVLVVGLVATLFAVHSSAALFCFPPGNGVSVRNCPTGGEPAWSDVLIISALGMLGGALTAALSIRNLKGTSTPYDVPVALAVFKVPLGALTAITGLIAIQGEFVPGLSVLDSRGQILAYALVFGFAQQVLSRLLDRRAQDLLEALPGGTAAQPSQPGPGTLTRLPDAHPAQSSVVAKVTPASPNTAQANGAGAPQANGARAAAASSAPSPSPSPRAPARARTASRPARPGPVKVSSP